MAPPRSNKQAAVEMSAFSSVEERLEHILKVSRCSKPTPLEQRRRVVVLATAVGVLIAIFGASTIRLTPAMAQQESGAQPRPLFASDPSGEHLTSEATWYSRFEKCKVLDVPTGSGGVVFNVRGKAVRPDGTTPAAGAIVLLKEWSLSRAAMKWQDRRRNSTAYEHATQRVDDVFAKTIADEQGRFQFKEAAAPSIPESEQDFWGWYIVVADANDGGFVGWRNLTRQDSTSALAQPINITLEKTEVVRGSVVDPNDQPIANALIVVREFGKESSGNRGDLDCHASQLSPQARTDSEGRFAFAGVPTSSVLSLQVHHPDWAAGSGLVATSADIPPGERFLGEAHMDRLSIGVVQSSPAKLVADAGYLVKGKIVNALGDAIAGAQVCFRHEKNYVQSDSRGHFQIRISSTWLEHEPVLESQLEILAPEDSDYLMRYVELTAQHIRSGDPMTIEMQKGVRVSGIVLADDDQQPLGDVLLQSVLVDQVANAPYGGWTNDEGRFQFTLPIGEVRLILASDSFMYSLPSLYDTEWFMEYPELGKPWFYVPDLAESTFHIDVDTSDGKSIEVPPIKVGRSGPIQVTGRLPDGTVVVGATVIAKDQIPGFPAPRIQQDSNPFAVGRKTRPASEVVNISEQIITDEYGQALLSIWGSPRYKPYVEIRHTVGDTSFTGQADLSEAVDGKLDIKLDAGWTIRGRVSLDGQPLEGARIILRSYDPPASERLYAITTSDGVYSVAVEPNRRYQIGLVGIPGHWRVNDWYWIDREVDGVLQEHEFKLVSGTEQIAGKVVDGNRKPVVGARIRIDLPLNSTKRNLLVGEAINAETDANGRFQLKKIPSGEDKLWVTGPKNEKTGAYAKSELRAKTGSLDVLVPLDISPPSSRDVSR